MNSTDNRITAIGIVVRSGDDSVMQARKALLYVGISSPQHPARRLLEAIEKSIAGRTGLYAVALVRKRDDRVGITTITGLQTYVTHAAKSLHGDRAVWVMPVDERAQQIIRQALAAVVERMEVVL